MFRCVPTKVLGVSIFNSRKISQPVYCGFLATFDPLAIGR